MNNYYQYIKQQSQTKVAPQRKKHINIMGSFQRRWEFEQNMDRDMISALQFGVDQSIPQVRKQSKPMQFQLYNNEEDRVNSAQQQYQSSHLELIDYKPQQYILRERIHSLEGPNFSIIISIFSFESKPRLRKDEATFNSERNQIYDHQSKDMQMVYFPKWKPDVKLKFIGTVKPKQQIPQFYNDVYIDGFENIGQLKRDNSPNTNFISIIRPKEDFKSTSIRKWKEDQIINKSMTNTGFSTSTSLPRKKIYKKSINFQLYKL